MCTHSPEEELNLSNISLLFSEHTCWESSIYRAEDESVTMEEDQSPYFLQMLCVKWCLTYLSTGGSQISTYKLIKLTQISHFKYLKISMPQFYLTENKFLRLKFISGCA